MQVVGVADTGILYVVTGAVAVGVVVVSTTIVLVPELPHPKSTTVATAASASLVTIGRIRRRTYHRPGASSAHLTATCHTITSVRSFRDAS